MCLSIVMARPLTSRLSVQAEHYGLLDLDQWVAVFTQHWLAKRVAPVPSQ